MSEKLDFFNRVWENIAGSKVSGETTSNPWLSICYSSGLAWLLRLKYNPAHQWH